MSPKAGDRLSVCSDYRWQSYQLAPKAPKENQMKANIGKNRSRVLSERMHRMVFLLCGIALALVLAVTQSQHAQAGNSPIKPPDVPSIIQVPAGNQPFRVAHAVGTQNYVCLSTGWASTAYGPQATLFNEDGEQILTHFLIASPAGSDATFPAWQDSRDTSIVWASAVKDARYTPDPTAIAWLLLKVVDTAPGPTGGDKMLGTTYIQRVNTTGGLIPTRTCNPGDKALVPYTADYYFYKATDQ
jgi:hypothetical protein